MKLFHPLLLLQLLSFVFGSYESCVLLRGIEVDGDGHTALNLDEIKLSMGVEIFDFSNPVIGTLAECSSEGQSRLMRVF